MPIARVQLPDGRVGRFEVPEGTTAEQATQLATQHFQQMQQSTEQPAQQSIEQSTQQPTQQPVSAGRTALEQGLQGATFGFADEASNRIGAGIASLVTGEPYKNLLNEAQQQSQQRLTQQVEQRPGLSLASNVAGGLATGAAGASTKLGGLVSAGLRSGGLGAQVAKGALAGAASGGLYGAGSAAEGERLKGAAEGAAIGGAIGGAVPAAGAAASAVKSAVIPKIDEAIKPLVKRAQDFGIPLRADQVAPSRVRNTVQKVSQEVPFSGVDKFEDAQNKAFNKAIAKTLGQDADNASPETIKKFRDDVSQKFNSVVGGKEIAVTPEDLQNIQAIKTSARKSIETGLADVVDKNVDDVVKDLQEGALSGKKLASIRSELAKTATRAQGGSSEFIGDLVDSIDDIAAKNITEEEGKVLAGARRQWRNFRTIQPLLEKSTDGNINPTQLINRVASSRFIDASNKAVGEDDLVDLARIGKEFLPKKGGSDTFQKTALTLGVGSAGGLASLAVTNPLLAAQTVAGAGGAMLANRGLQAVNTSQRLIKAGLKEPTKAKSLKGLSNALIAGAVNGN